MFDLNLKPIPENNIQQLNTLPSRPIPIPSIHTFGTNSQRTSSLPTIQGFVYNPSPLKPDIESPIKEKYLSIIQKLGNSESQITEKLRQSGFSRTKSGTLEIPIFKIGVNRYSEQKTGEYAYLMMGSPDKNSMYSVTTFRLTNGDLLTKIETVLNGSDLFSVLIVKVGNNGYQVNTPLAPQGVYIPLDIPLDAVNFAVASIWLGAMSVFGKHLDSSATTTEYPKQSNGTISPTINKNKKDEILGDEVMCTPHDMGCSAGGLITPDGKFNFWFPCAGSFSADVYDCCYRHDVGLYCSTSYFDALEKDYNLVNCISAKIIAAGIEAMSWTCRWLFALPLIALFEGVSVLGYIAFLIIPYKSDKVNYNGKHTDSCLCGGTKPTECCDSDKVMSICLDGNCKKVDLCKAKGERIKNPQCNPQKNCFNCYWKCLYSDEGDYLGKEYITDPTRKLPCCVSIQPKGGLKCPV